MEVLGRKYHTGCRKCDFCHSSLAGRHYFALNGGVFCADHKSVFMNCRACEKPISGSILVALKNQRQYHPEHFNCKQCKKNLSTVSFFEKDDEPYCNQCYYMVSLKGLDAAPSSTETHLLKV
jgi:paxillin